MTIDLNDRNQKIIDLEKRMKLAEFKSKKLV